MCNQSKDILKDTLLHNRYPEDSKLPQVPRPGPHGRHLLWGGGQDVKLTAATISLWPPWALEVLTPHANEPHATL